jgi:hypothetical protein
LDAIERIDTVGDDTRGCDRHRIGCAEDSPMTVKAVTSDLASAMNPTVRKTFPGEIS